MTNYQLLITCPKGIEETLKLELENLNLTINGMTVGGVKVETNLSGLYQCILNLRTANRVLIHLYSDKVKQAEDLTKQAEKFNWQQHFNVENTLWIDFNGNDENIRNTMFGAQCIKDGISDYFRNINGRRPAITKNQPDIKLKAIFRRGFVNVYLDVLGKSLHQRGYRMQQGIAPLKENVASGLLMQAKWPEIAEQGGALIDPFCGSGTFLIEAWQIATKAVPGLQFGEFLELEWQDHDQTLWQGLYQQAKYHHQQAALKFEAPILGFDIDSRTIEKAKNNIAAAGLEKCIQVAVKSIDNFSKPSHLKSGLVICNPPFGERLSEVNELLDVYKNLGKQVKEQCLDWRLAVLTSEQKLSKAIGLKSFRQYKVKNGALDCMLALFEINEANKFNIEASKSISNEGQVLLNRIKKNQKKLVPWLKQQSINSYRLYDADLPEYNVAIDVYSNVEGGNYLHVQEYKAPKTLSDFKVEQRIKTVMDVLTIGLGYSLDKISLKQRQRQKGKKQYERVEQSNERMIVKDGSINCFVNLKDYLDTGLFLDHRRLRTSFDNIKAPAKFLNLFCYTGVASLHAAKNGAVTTNVDLSHTYLNWAKDNFRINNHTIDKHDFIHADVLKWITESETKYEVIFCDPPSFSNSKRMEGVLDIQEDHPRIIELCMDLLTQNGQLYFSCNLKGFKLSKELSEIYKIEEMTRQTTSKDFDGSRNTHQSYKIELQ